MAGSPLGTLYLDLVARPDKFNGAAHYVVRCGKATNEMDGGLETAMGLKVQPLSDASNAQLPIVVLVASLGVPQSLSSLPRSPNPSYSSGSMLDATLLASPEVETLFHEFGHALHSMLSATEFQHLHGTRGPIDWVELPSHLTEYWARDPAAAATWTTDARGDAVPLETLEVALARRSAFRALDLQVRACIRTRVRVSWMLSGNLNSVLA